MNPAGVSEPGKSGYSNYLDVRYHEGQRPYTGYPEKLTAYLTDCYLAERRGCRLLDLGSGRGEFLHGFSLLGFDGVGVDRSRPSRPRFHETVIEADYEKQPLPFRDHEFQVIFSKSVFEHIWDISRLLGECRRVLAPGGRMLTLVPDWQAQWRHFYDDWTHVRPFTLTGLRECLQSHGFSIGDARRFRQLPVLWHYPYLRPVADLAALLPRVCKASKFVRFAKEWMLLVVADAV